MWVHGDVALANLLVGGDGRLCAVLDFGCSAVGDPACDTVTFVHSLCVDDATWARGRGWALWKSLVMITNPDAGQAEFARYVLDELFAEM